MSDRRVARPTSRVVFTGAVVLLTGAALRESLSFATAQDRLFPVCLSGVALLLSVVLLARELFDMGESKMALDLGFDEEERPANTTASVKLLAWPIGLIIATYFFGIVWALIPFVIGYLVFVAHMKWYKAAVGAVIQWILVVVVLQDYLAVTLPPGMFGN